MIATPGDFIQFPVYILAILTEILTDPPKHTCYIFHVYCIFTPIYKPNGNIFLVVIVSNKSDIEFKANYARVRKSNITKYHYYTVLIGNFITVNKLISSK